MTGATAFQRTAIGGKFNQIQRQDFLSLYPNRIQGILRAPGCKDWTTVSKHFPVADKILLRAVSGEETNVWGLRWGDSTRFAVFDIDNGSKYKNVQELTRLNEALALIGLTTTVYQSSTRLGWHVYLFFDQWENSTEVQEILKSWLRAHNYEIRNGVLEVFPSGMGLRLPLQPGFAWLDQTGNVITRREELSTSEATSHFLKDLETRASDWQTAKSLIASQLERISQTKSVDALAHQKATDTAGFDRLFSGQLIPEKYQDGRQFWQFGLNANGQRHDAILAVGHYLWHGDPSADIPALPGQSNNRLRYELIRAWIEQKHNGFCNHIKRGNWRKVEAQIKRTVAWRRPAGTKVREDYALTERALERQIGLSKSTGRVWSMEDFKKGNEGRRETAREKIKAAFELLTAQGRKVTLRQLMRLTGCHHQTINRHADIWRISQNPVLTRVSGDSNPFLDLDLLPVSTPVRDHEEFSCSESPSFSLPFRSSPVVSLFDRSDWQLESSKVVPYTSDNPSFGLFMADEVEKKIEAPSTSRSLEEIVRASQFTDPSKLDTWTAATADYRVTQKDSATMEALSDEKIAEIKSNGGFQKFELFDSAVSKPRETFIDPHPSFVEGLKAVGADEEAQGRFSIEYMERKAQEALGIAQKPTEEQILVASNLTAGVPIHEQLEQEQTIQSDLERDTKIAWDPQKAVQKQLEKSFYPHRDNTESWIDTDAARVASQKFPRLAAFSERHEGIGPRLIGAILQNEQTYYRSDKDAVPDAIVRQTGSVGFDVTIGPAQMKVSNIKHLASQYPDILGSVNDSTHLATDKWYATMLVGAYLDQKIQTFEEWSKHPPDRTKLSKDERFQFDHALPLWKAGMETKALAMSYTQQVEKTISITC